MKRNQHNYEYLNRHEIKEATGFSYKVLQSLMNKGEFPKPTMKIKGMDMWKRDDLERWELDFNLEWQN